VFYNYSYTYFLNHFEILVYSVSVKYYTANKRNWRNLLKMILHLFNP